jgi:hypothetical protein
VQTLGNSNFVRESLKLGLRGLYKGFLVYSIASLPAYIVYVTSYTWSKSALGEESPAVDAVDG